MDWLQAAISEKRIDFFPFIEEFNTPVFIAQGGSGAIYCATSKKRKKQYALKYLPSVEYDSYDSFVKELQLLRRVDDEDFVARCYGVSKDPMTNSYILVMKFAEQGSLADYLKNSKDRLTWSDRLMLAHQITEALDFIHDRNVIHRDLHSGNILINAAGRALITDFGLSRPASAKTSANVVAGRVPYIPPERIRNTQVKHDARGDVYSLGVIFWEISANGAHPMPYADFMTPMRICDGMREDPIEGTPKEYVELYTQCWDDDPARRPTVVEILMRLDSIIEIFAEAEVEQDENGMEDIVSEGFMTAVLGPPAEEDDQTRIVLRKLKEECNLHRVPLRRITSYTENLATFPAAEGFFQQVYHVQNDVSVVVQRFRQMTLLQRVTEVVCLLKLRGIPNVGQMTEILEDETGGIIGLSMVKYHQTLKQYTHSHSHSHRWVTAHQKYHLIHEMLRALHGIHECGLAHRNLSEINMMVNESEELLEDGSRMPLLYMICFRKATFCNPEDVRKWWVQPEEDAEDGRNPYPKTEKELEEACAKLPWVKGTPDHRCKTYRSIQTLPKSRVDITLLPYMIHPQAEDVYSLGVIIWKTFTETEPWQGTLDTDLKSLRHKIEDDYRIQRILEKEIKGDFSRQLVSMCLKVNPLDRRNADEILRWIETPQVMTALIKEWTPEKNSTGGAGRNRRPVEKREGLAEKARADTGWVAK